MRFVQEGVAIAMTSVASRWLCVAAAVVSALAKPTFAPENKQDRLHAHPKKSAKSFEDVRDTVAHVVHQPKLELSSSLFTAEHAPTNDDELAVRLHLPVDANGRTAVVNARVAQDLVGPGYRETFLYSNGTRAYTTLPASQRRCYWRGTVAFSDGATGSMAFSSCGRSSRPHSAFLAEHDGHLGDTVDQLALSTPLHYVHGMIRDHTNGEQYAVEPREWLAYRQSNHQPATKTEPRNLASAVSETMSPHQHTVFLGDHYAYRVQDYADATQRKGCGNDEHHHEHDRHRHHEASEQHEHRRPQRTEPPLSQALRQAGAAPWDATIQRRRLTGSKMYMELQVANDKARCDAVGSQDVGDDTLAIVNQVALYYGQAGMDDGLDYDGASECAHKQKSTLWHTWRVHCGVLQCLY